MFQGICSVYEKQPDLVNSANLELIECYERLLDSIGLATEWSDALLVNFNRVKLWVNSLSR